MVNQKKHLTVGKKTFQGEETACAQMKDISMIVLNGILSSRILFLNSPHNPLK